MDVAFIGGTAYALVTVVGPDVGGSDVVGIYRSGRPEQLHRRRGHRRVRPGQSAGEPAFDVPTGVQYALRTYRGGFLVTDGHHNRVLRVTLDGDDHRDDRLRQHRPDRAGGRGQHDLHGRGRPRPPPARDGKVVAFGPKSTDRHEVASGAPLARRRGVRPRSRALTPSRRATSRAALRGLRRCRTPARS